MLVRLFKYWTYPDVFRQTPGGHGEWEGVRFVIDEPGEADYVVIHGHMGASAQVRCPPDSVWLVMGEAPHPWARPWHDAPAFIDRVYMTESSLVSPKRRLSTAFLPWWVNRSYDQLKQLGPCEKSLPLSWITSNRATYAGHERRMRFLAKVQSMEELSLFGHGFNPLADKWDGLAPYRYSIAFENYSNSHYWSEKVMDCFLAWTMPIYFGCTDLGQFFPRESFVQLDPDISDPAGFVRDVVNSPLRERRMDAIAEARRRVLEDHNLFNLIVNEIRAAESDCSRGSAAKRKVALRDHSSTPMERFALKTGMAARRTGGRLKRMVTGMPPRP